MKRKLMLGLLSAVGGLTIIGSGFSAWYFGDHEIEDSVQNVNAHVTPVADTLGTISVTDLAGVSLQLDQGGYDNKTDITKGISFTHGTETTFNSNIVASYTIGDTQSINVNNAGFKATFNCVITLKKEFAEYIEFKDSFYGETFTPEIDTVTGNTTITLSKDINYGSAINTSYTFHIDTDPTTKVNSAFQYKSGKKPTTAEQYNTFKELNNHAANVLTFSFSLKVVNK